MRLAALADGGPDGRLVVLSADHTRRLPAPDFLPTLQAALERWSVAEAALAAVAARLAAGEGVTFDPAAAGAPLPRAWQWLDGSAFPVHGRLMQTAFDLPPIETDRPLMYQGLSHRFLAGHADVALPQEADGIDFEGEFAVLTDHVGMGISAAAALGAIRLIVLINDWSLRRIAPIEMKTGFGWIQAKPACSLAPVAVTPDELGTAWHDGRVCLDLRIARDGVAFGAANGREMAFGFHELIAHAAYSRDLPAGTLIGSGTVSNAAYATVGSSCIAERRAIEMIAGGHATTPFLRFGERVRMQAADPRGNDLFGAIDQRVVQAPRQTGDAGGPPHIPQPA